MNNDDYTQFLWHGSLRDEISTQNTCSNVKHLIDLFHIIETSSNI